MSTGTPPDRRRIKRRRSKIRLRFWNGSVDKVAYASDVSSEGLFIETRQPLAVGTRLHIELYISGDSFFSEGVVTHCSIADGPKSTQQKVGLGVRMVTLGDALAQSAAQGAKR